MGYETFPKDGQGHRMLGEQKRTKYAPDAAKAEATSGHGSSRTYPKGASEAMKSRRQSHGRPYDMYAKAGGNAQVSAHYPPGSKKYLIRETLAKFKLFPLMSKHPKKA